MAATKPTASKAGKAASEAGGGFLASAHDLADQVGDVASQLVDRVPGTADAVKGSALDAWHSVESMPKPQRNKLASFSLAIGAALYFIGAPRLLTFLAFLPALAVGGSNMARGMGKPRRTR